MDQENNKQEDTPSSEQNPMLMVKTEIPPTKMVFAEDQSKKNDEKDGK
ncbi:MAG: hypothetical protein RR413_10535 [Christensenellaceae bacterium]